MQGCPSSNKGNRLCKMQTHLVAHSSSQVYKSSRVENKAKHHLQSLGLRSSHHKPTPRKEVCRSNLLEKWAQLTYLLLIKLSQLLSNHSSKHQIKLIHQEQAYQEISPKFKNLHLQMLTFQPKLWSLRSLKPLPVKAQGRNLVLNHRLSKHHQY
jgi:hypothetical protein